MWTRLSLLICGSALAISFPAHSRVSAARAPSLSPALPNVINDWALIGQNTIAPAVIGGATQSAHGAMVPIAMYDAVVAIEGGYEPYTSPVIAPAGADVTAAVATAAYRVLHERFPAQQASLDGQYASYMSGIPDGQPKLDGAAVGEAVAQQLLAMRAGDSLGTCTGLCSTTWVQPTPGPGVFDPFPAGSIPQAADLRLARPWTMRTADQFRPGGPLPLTSLEYADDWIETRDWGSSSSALRSSYDTDTARFWAGQNFFMTRTTLWMAATDYGLDVRQTARLFAMGFTAAADGAIGCFDAKYHYMAWRPRTAISRADSDGNPLTEPADPTWTPLLATPNHPEYPAAHGCVSYALYDAMRAFFGRDTPIRIQTISPPAPVSSAIRTYDKFNDIEKEIVDARVFGGMHFRHSAINGGQLGRKVAKNLVNNFFRPTSSTARHGAFGPHTSIATK
jgi:vanadium-dependent haloperoxidase-like protein